MNIDINVVSIELTKEQMGIVAKELAKKEEPTYLPVGTICWVWSNNTSDKYLRFANGNGMFLNSTDSYPYAWGNYEPIEMGLIFSEKVITSEDIVPDMHKKLTLCWVNEDIAAKRLRVINADNGCTFAYDGSKDGYKFNNYQLCTTPYPNLPQWARDMIDACED